MKETQFIKQNKEKWNRFEELYESKSNDPEELSDLYLDITDDLSYAQTFYPKRTVRVYLNQLAQKVYTGVHKRKGEPIKKFITVWKTSLPLEIYRSRKNLLFAFVLFLIYFLIGAMNVSNDPYFLDDVAGYGYVDMTIENIEKGNPLGVYQSGSQMDMFIAITTNNLKVAFMTFVFGFFLTIGTHILLFFNGVMVGAFQYFFHGKGLLITSFLGIWIHGAFEISAIVLAAGAGITAGNGILFPKSYTRIQSLQLSTKRGLKIMLSLVPFIIIAGFLESFVTRNYQDLPDWSKWMLILLSFGIILGYYVLYPIYVARKHPELLDKEETSSFKQPKEVDLYQIRDAGANIATAFGMYRSMFSKFAKINTLIVFPIVIALVTMQDIQHYDLQQTEYWYDWSAQLELMMGYCFFSVQDYIVFGLWTVVIALMFSSVFWSIKSRSEAFSWRSYFTYMKKRFLGIWLGNFILCVSVLILPWYLLLVYLFIVPFFYLNAASMGLDDSKFGQRFGKGFRFSTKHYGNTLLILLILIVLTAILLQPVAFVLSIHDYNGEPTISDLLDIAANFVKRIAQIFTSDYMFWANVLRQIVYLIFFFAIVPMIAFTMAIAYYSQVEKTEAIGLKKAFEKFGKRNRFQEKDIDYE